VERGHIFMVGPGRQ